MGRVPSNDGGVFDPNVANTFSETLVESAVVRDEFNRRVSTACQDMNDVTIKHRRLIGESRELIAKIDKLLESDRFLGFNGKDEPERGRTSS
jgi:hypothetical protein